MVVLHLEAANAKLKFEYNSWDVLTSVPVFQSALFLLEIPSQKTLNGYPVSPTSLGYDHYSHEEIRVMPILHLRHAVTLLLISIPS